MNSVREILASKVPSAEFSESEPLTVTVPASELRAAALELIPGCSSTFWSA